MWFDLDVKLIEDIEIGKPRRIKIARKFIGTCVSNKNFLLNIVGSDIPYGISISILNVFAWKEEDREIRRRPTNRGIPL